MKSGIGRWITLRLFLVLALVFRYFVAYSVARRWNVPIQDTLLGVLLFYTSWTDTQLYFERRTSQEVLRGKALQSQTAPKEKSHAQLKQAALILRSDIRP